MECARRAAHNGKSVFLLGGRPGVAEKAANNLCARFPRLKIAGVHDGYFDFASEENSAVISEINRSGADVLFVCIGAPLQEKWVYKNRADLSSARLIACLGGSLDIYAGEAKRAPALFIKSRAEWLWRLLREPRRIVRMINLPKFVISVYRYKRKLKKTRNIK